VNLPGKFLNGWVRLNKAIEAILDWKNHKITRQHLIQQLLKYERWLMPSALPQATTQQSMSMRLNEALTNWDAQSVREHLCRVACSARLLLFSSGDTVEEFDALYSSAALRNTSGLEVFCGDLRGVKQVIFDRASRHELVIAAEEFPEWIAAAKRLAQQSSVAVPTPADTRALVVPCAKLTLDAPLRWLQLGWQDFKKARALSLFFGVVIALISGLISLFAYSLGRFALLAALLSGFVFVAPLIAVGMYCVSRQLAAGRTPRLRDSFALAKRVVGQAGVFALLQLVLLMVWSRAGMMVSAFVPMEPGNTMQLLEFLAIGSIIGSVFALLTFASMAFSLPMIADRNVDMVTACISSIHAVMQNKVVSMYWAAIVSVLTLFGFATVFLGLIVVMPWLAYSAWHAYCETLDASEWPVFDLGEAYITNDGTAR
jgi:uncharacterized membrane protein